MATIIDVARHAGVSTATVSRVLSGKNPVSDEMRERVLETVDLLGYRPNALARSLREEHTKTLGLVIGNVMNPFFTSIARAVEDAAMERGYTVSLGNSDESSEKEEAYLKVLLENRVDGLIISPARAESPHLVRVVEEGVPVVFVDRSIEGVGAPVVRADGRRAVEELVGYLVGLGHERLATISGPSATISGRERLDDFIGAASEHGVAVPEEFVKVGDFRRASGFAAMRELLELPRHPTAVFAANNLMALGALQAIREAGLRVPEDVSLASFDDVSWFGLVDPPVTAIAQPTQELGKTAAGMLFEMMEEGGSPESRILAAKLVIRDSCGSAKKAAGTNSSNAKEE